MKSLCLIPLFLAFGLSCFGQLTSSFRNDIKNYRSEQNKKFADSRTSPLTEKDLIKFEGLCFYKPKASYQVTAKLVRNLEPKPFEMPTTTDRRPLYEKYGELHFELKGQRLRLNVYQSQDSRRNPIYRNHLFLPFKDKTNTKNTYGGGRFIDLKIPKGDHIIIDFNMAYNPYCAYNEQYSCPLVPPENHLKIAVKAGEKKLK